MSTILNIDMDDQGEVSLNYINDETRLTTVLFLAGQSNRMLRTGILSAAMNMLSVQNPETRKDFIRQMQELSRDNGAHTDKGKTRMAS